VIRQVASKFFKFVAHNNAKVTEYEKKVTKGFVEFYE